MRLSVRQRRPTPSLGSALPFSVLMLFVLSLMNPAHGAPPSVSEAQLEKPISATSSFWNGSHAYIVGGSLAPSEHSDKIYRYDPSRHSLELLPERLPSPRYGMASVWTGEYAYFFGGYGTAASTDILRYEPGTGEIKQMRALLPAPTHWASATWDGEFAYIVGGLGPHGASQDTIVRYSPAADAIETMQVRLPTPLHAPSVHSVDGSIYILGGVRMPGQVYTDQILTYNPQEDTLSIIKARLPTPRDLMASTWNGEHIYLLGGRDATGALSQMLAFAPASGTIQILNDVLPGTANQAMGLADDGRLVYLIGGETHWESSRTARILQFQLPPEQSAASRADPGPPETTTDGNDPPTTTSGDASTSTTDGSTPATAGEAAPVRVEIPSPTAPTVVAVALLTVALRRRP